MTQQLIHSEHRTCNNLDAYLGGEENKEGGDGGGAEEIGDAGENKDEQERRRRGQSRGIGCTVSFS